MFQWVDGDREGAGEGGEEPFEVVDVAAGGELRASEAGESVPFCEEQGERK